MSEDYIQWLMLQIADRFLLSLYHARLIVQELTIAQARDLGHWFNSEEKE